MKRKDIICLITSALEQMPMEQLRIVYCFVCGLVR